MTERRPPGDDELEAALGRALLERREFERLEAELGEGAPQLRRLGVRLALGRAVLELTGEGDYDAVRIEDLVARAGTNRLRFYESFLNKDACFAAAYGAATDALVGRTLAICEEAPDWATGMRRCLRDLGDLLAAEPAICGGLLAGSGPAAAAVAGIHDEVVGRLSRAVDRARRETDESRHPSPPFTSRFILSGIQGLMVKFLARPEGRDLDEELAGMLYIAVALYRSPQEAAAEVRRFRAEAA